MFEHLLDMSFKKIIFCIFYLATLSVNIHAIDSNQSRSGCLDIAYNLREQFKDLHKMHIVEIGGECGKQCKILADVTGFASYTIIDSSENLHLAKNT